MLIRLESAFLRELHVLRTPRSGLVTLEMTPILVKLPSSPSAPSPSILVWGSRSVGDGRGTEDSLGPNPVGPCSSWWLLVEGKELSPGHQLVSNLRPQSTQSRVWQRGIHSLGSTAACLPAECAHGHHLTGKCFQEASRGKMVGWKKGRSDLNP